MSTLDKASWGPCRCGHHVSRHTVDDTGRWTCQGLQPGCLPYRGCACPELRYLHTPEGTAPWDFFDSSVMDALVGTTSSLDWLEAANTRTTVFVQELDEFLTNIQTLANPGDFFSEFVKERWWIFAADETTTRWKPGRYYTNLEFRFIVLAAGLRESTNPKHREFLTTL